MTKTIRLAIAEDVPELAQLTVQKFNQLEEVNAMFIAYNGLEMVEKLKETEVDVILMDINMPVLNGCDTTAQFRALEKESEHMPIIALTANVMKEDVNGYYKAGMDDHLSKPFTANKLRDILNKWIPQSKVEQEIIQTNISSDTDTSNLDDGMINNLKEMMGEGYNELVDTYIRRSLDLKEAIINNKDDIEKLILDVHSLKGSSGTMGAKALFSICEEFESLLRKGKASNKERTIEKISNELNAVHEYLMRQGL